MIDWAVIKEKFFALDQGLLEEAAHELDSIGLIEIGHTPGGISFVRPGYSLYWSFDQAEMGYGTEEDAAELAKALLADPKMGSLEDFVPVVTLLLISIFAT